MIVPLLWLAFIILAAYLADQKKRSIGGFIILAIFTGPLAVIILLLISPKDSSKSSLSYQHERMSLPAMQHELGQLKSLLKLTQERLSRLERSLNLTEDSPTVAPVSPQQLSPSPVKASIPLNASASSLTSTQTVKVTKPLDLEMAFGRNWLSKIGIVVFTLGMVFLISYTFKYFGPAIKILFGFVVSGLFFFVGKKLEHNEKFVHFGRVVWGGGWAIAYFTAYAMHHFPASRLIENPYVGLSLLAILVIGLLVYVVKYKNEDMMAVALFASYVAATLGQVTNFTLMSSLLLSGVVLFLVYKFQWIKTFAMCIILTYGIHQFWVVPNIAFYGENILWWTVTPVQFTQLMNLAFLTAYGVMFMIAAHIAKTQEETGHENTMAAVNFGNILCYSILAYPFLTRYFSEQRFMIILIAGLVFFSLALAMKKAGRTRMYHSDVIVAFFLLWFALPLKFAAISSVLIGMIQVPFLLLAAWQLKEKIYTYLAYALSVYLGFYLLFHLGSMGQVTMAGFVMLGRHFVLYAASLVSAISFYLLRRNHDTKTDFDSSFEYFYPAVASLSLASVLMGVVTSPWTSLALCLEGAVLLALSMILVLKRFRVYAYLVLFVAVVCFLDQRLRGVSDVIKWVIIVANVGILGATYHAVKVFSRLLPKLAISKAEVQSVFVGALLVLAWTIFNHSPERMISLVLGLVAVLLIIYGIWNKDKTQRLGGLVFFGITLCRVVFVDLSGLDVIFKIITFIVLGLLFLGASYVYNRFGKLDN